jgi:hypothetical protein
MDQTRPLAGGSFRGEVDLAQEGRPPVVEEDVCPAQQLYQAAAIAARIEPGRTHADIGRGIDRFLLALGIRGKSFPATEGGQSGGGAGLGRDPAVEFVDPFLDGGVQFCRRVQQAEFALQDEVAGKRCQGEVHDRR